jgi:hypothetical protein
MPNQQQKRDSESKKLYTQLSVLNENLKGVEQKLSRLSSIPRNFFLSLFKGLAHALGFTLFFALVVTILARILGPIVQNSFIKDLNKNLENINQLQQMQPGQGMKEFQPSQEDIDNAKKELSR